MTSATLNKHELPARRTMTVEEVAAIVGVGRSTLYAHVRNGTVPSVRVGRRVAIPSHIVDAMLAGSRKPAT